MEVLVAVAVFAFAVLGLLFALNVTTDAARETLRQQALRAELQSRLARLSVPPYNEGGRPRSPAASVSPPRSPPSRSRLPTSRSCRGIGASASSRNGRKTAKPMNGMFPISPSMRSNSRAAFTLIEVLIAMVVFMLLVGGIFTVVAVSTTSAREITTTRLQGARLDSFQTLVRTVFLNLPFDARIDLRVREVKGGSAVELLIFPAPDFMDFSTGGGGIGLSLAALPDGRGAYTVSMANFHSREGEDREKELADAAWIPLLPDVRSVQWRFGMPGQPVLQETWDANSGRPAYVVLNLTLSDGSASEFTFGVPVLTRAGAQTPRN